MRCPDGGVCHHECESKGRRTCWRTEFAAPLSPYESWADLIDYGDPLAPARGIVYGVLLCTLLVVLILTAWWLI